MTHKILVTASATLLAALLSASAAQAQPKCGPLQQVNIIQMVRASPTRSLVPLTINGATKHLVLDTGAPFTMITEAAVEDLKLPIKQNNLQMYNVTGGMSRHNTVVPGFTLGRMQSAEAPLLVMDGSGFSDGLFGMDYIQRFDADFDFGTDTFQMFSPDHCPGGVLYWKAPAVAVVPISVKNSKISIPVTLDGKEIKAVIDTGAPYSTLRIDIAERRFDMKMGGTDTPENGMLNGDPTLKTYGHVFQSLAFGGIAVSNPRFTLIPNAMGRGERQAVTGSRTQREGDRINTPEILLGMNVLRQLHVYFAFKEDKMYVTPTAPPDEAQRARMETALNAYTAQRAVTPAGKAAYKRTVEARLKARDAYIATHPDSAADLNNRCWDRASIKMNLEGALADCEQSLKLRPGDASTLDSMGFALYQMGKYQEAVSAFDAVLKVDANHPTSLLVRGHAKGKLGDTAGMAADLAAAKAMDGTVEANFAPYDVNFP